MIGKVVRMLVGRRIARSHGYSGAAGAAIALIAPVVIKRVGKSIANRRAARREAKREREAPKYLDRIAETQTVLVKNS